jgi:hypothetical protein
MTRATRTRSDMHVLQINFTFLHSQMGPLNFQTSLRLGVSLEESGHRLHCGSSPMISTVAFGE